MEEKLLRLPSLSQKINPVYLIAFFIAIFVLASVVLLSTKNSSNQLKTAQNNTQNLSGEAFTIVYGSWSNNSSTVFAFDLLTNKEYVIAQLPVNVKKITFTSPNTFLYLSDTDEYDHAKSLVEYSIKQKNSRVLFETDTGYMIDDYVLSPNAQYASIWMVAPNTESKILLGGKSRVYSINLNNGSAKNLLYDENISITPIHYPRAVMNDGRVFFDTFVANSSAGWAYGMSISDFTGRQKQNILSMQNGTYGSQPIPSSDGKFLVFSGYDGTKGNGTAEINGFRRAISSPNTVELLDTTTLFRTKIADLSNTNIYSGVDWNDNTTVKFLSLSKESATRGVFFVDVKSFSKTKVGVTSGEIVLSKLKQNNLIGKVPRSVFSSNLGNGYSTIYSQLILKSEKQKIVLPVSQQMIQYIGVFDTSYLNQNFSSLPETSSSRNNLQLSALYIKPDIDEKRNSEQNDPPVPTNTSAPTSPPDSNNTPVPTTANKPTFNTKPTCGVLSRQHCDEVYNITSPNQRSQTPGYFECTGYYFWYFHTQSLCRYSPLYLYGKEGLKVKITIQTEVTNSTPTYNNGYNVILGKNGEFFVDSEKYNKISFNYTSAVPITKPPEGGILTSKDEVSQTVSLISKKLALNKTETDDLKSMADEFIKSQYSIISFFDHSKSHAILPIYFSPTPDVYRNIVFYFKNLDFKPSFSIPSPKFEPIRRFGFTAVEISGIAD